MTFVIERQQMPALVVSRLDVTSIAGQLPRLDRTLFQSDLASQLLCFRQQPMM
jgi:hypothetical protein